MPTAPAISVIMPVADVAYWVGSAIESVLAQEVELELLVAIERSTDGTGELVHRIAERDPRVRPLDTAGVGGGEARNIAIAAARGRYLAFADGDDLVPSGAYAALLAQAERSGSPMVIGDHLDFRPNRIHRYGDGVPIYRERTGIRLADEPRFVRDRVSWIRLIARDAWNAHGLRFSGSRRANDIAAMTGAYCTLVFDVIPRPVYYYRWRVGEGSMTSQKHGRAEYGDYISEETRCAELIDGYGVPAVSREYADFLLRHDIPNHLLPRLVAMHESGGTAEPTDFDTTAALARRQYPHVDWTPGRPALVPVALVAAGQIPAAQLAALALRGTQLLGRPEQLSDLPRALKGLDPVHPADRTALARNVLDHQLGVLVARRDELDPAVARATLAALRPLGRSIPRASLDTRTRALLSPRAAADPRGALATAASAAKGVFPLSARIPRALGVRMRWLLGRNAV